VDELEMNQPAISHHMAKLKQAGLLKSRREGQWIHYSLKLEAVKNGCAGDNRCVLLGREGVVRGEAGDGKIVVAACPGNREVWQGRKHWYVVRVAV
jgi:DNA-binding transcriptional ArsR family regulator